MRTRLLRRLRRKAYKEVKIRELCMPMSNIFEIKRWNKALYKTQIYDIAEDAFFSKEASGKIRGLAEAIFMLKRARNKHIREIVHGEKLMIAEKEGERRYAERVKYLERF